MIENECKIIKDLLPNYVENITSKETDKFIEGHLKTCEKCKEELENLKELEVNQEKAEKDRKKKEKKLKRKNMIKLILKIIVILIIVGLACAWGYKLYKHIKGKNNHELIEQVYNKYQEIKEAGNYRVSVENKSLGGADYTSDRDSRFICVNGKTKEELISMAGIEVKYAAIIDNCRITLNIENDSKYEELFITSNFDEHDLDITRYNMADTHLAVLEVYKELDAGQLSGFDVKKKKYQGKQYYVIIKTVGSKEEESYSYSEIWVEKEAMLVERMCYENVYSDGYESKYEYRFNWSIGTVSEAEINMTQEEKQKINEYIQKSLKEAVPVGDPEKDQYIPRMREKLNKAKILLEKL